MRDDTVPGKVHPKVLTRQCLPDTAGNGAEEAHDDEEQDNAEDEQVQQSVETGLLEDRLAAVLHQLRLSTGKDDHPKAPLGVSQSTPSQQHLLIVQRELGVAPLERALKTRQIVVRRFADDLSLELRQQLYTIL